MIEFDADGPIRGPERLRDLVEAVFGSDDHGAEHHAIEWKVSLDLNAPAGQFAVARAIVAFGNRAVDAASRHFAGYAYVLVGVEPGNLVGQKQWDGERLGPALARYLGPDGPRWHHDNVSFHDNNVLVITVMPPSDGDRIHTIRKQYSPTDGKNSAREGAIFVRRNSISAPANTADIRALEHRLLDSTGKLRVSVEPGADELPLAIPLDLSEPARQLWAAEEKKALDARVTPAPMIPNSTSPFLNQLAGTLLDDPRTQTEYNAEVDRYLSSMRKILDQLCRSRAVRILTDRRFSVRLKNPHDLAIQDLLVRVEFPPGFEAHFELDSPDVPERPLPLGQRNALTQRRTKNSLIMPRNAVSPNRWVKNDEAGSHVRFTIARLHPQDSIHLDALTVLTDSNVQLGGTVDAVVTTTASNKRGADIVTLPVRIATKAYGAYDLLRPTQE